MSSKWREPELENVPVNGDKADCESSRDVQANDPRAKVIGEELQRI